VIAAWLWCGRSWARGEWRPGTLEQRLARLRCVFGDLVGIGFSSCASARNVRSSDGRARAPTRSRCRRSTAGIKDQRWPLAPLLIRRFADHLRWRSESQHVHGHHPYTRRIDRLRLFAARLGSAYRGDHGHLGGLWHGLRDAGEHYGNASVNDDRVHALGPPQYVDLLAPAPGHLSHITQPDDFRMAPAAGSSGRPARPPAFLRGPHRDDT